MPAVSGFARRRWEKASVHRVFSSDWTPRPSVIESPRQTTAALFSPFTHVSMPLRKYQCTILAAPLKVLSSVEAPAFR